MLFHNHAAASPMGPAPTGQHIFWFIKWALWCQLDAKQVALCFSAQPWIDTKKLLCTIQDLWCTTQNPNWSGISTNNQPDIAITVIAHWIVWYALLMQLSPLTKCPLLYWLIVFYPNPCLHLMHLLSPLAALHHSVVNVNATSTIASYFFLKSPCYAATLHDQCWCSSTIANGSLFIWSGGTAYFSPERLL